VPVTSYALYRQTLSMDKNEPKAIAAKALTEDEVRRWRESLEEADANGLFLAYACLVLAVGRKV
jgi:hypothetical protein